MAAGAASRRLCWLAVSLLLGGCSSSELAGIPAAPPAGSASVASSHDAPPAELALWNEKWRQVQARPESVALGDHWRVCEIKFRFRVYRDLFRCLDLIDARTDLDARERRYAPVITDWMRAEAYAELGQPVEALRSSEAGWAALPRKYQDGSAIYDAGTNPLQMLTPIGALVGKIDDFEAVAVEAGGSNWSDEGRGISVRQVGRHNPAGLDLRPQAIAMNLAAERALLHQQIGEIDQAKAALQDLRKWEDPVIPIAPTNFFELTASALSLGPMFALGNYTEVVKTYAELTHLARMEQAGRTMGFITTLGLSYLTEKIAAPDYRDFAVSLEDASRALIYAASLSRLGEAERAAQALDAVLAAPDIRQMGSAYWSALYERARIALKEGHREEAISLLRRAADAVEQGARHDRRRGRQGWLRNQHAASL
jgi:tetratricopeptide (TPR) repeat protein